MLSIRRETDYAARIVLHLSMLGDGVQITAEEVAQKRLLPRAFVRRIIRRLGTAGILCTIRGARGGIRLARPASDISLLDIVRAVEGGMHLNPCVANPLACPLTSNCPVRKSWTKVTAQITHSLAAIRFDKLAKASNTTRSKPLNLNTTTSHSERRKKGGSHGRA